MTERKALEVLNSWLQLAYHNADGTDEASAELYEALQTVFALITRQQSEIERLKALAENGASAIDTNNRLVQKFAEIKSEAVKEFAENLKENSEIVHLFSVHTGDHYMVNIDDIDNLVKEMGEDNAKM